MLNSFSRAPKAHAKIVVLLMLALLTFGVLSSSVMAEIRVLATGGDLSGPQATEEVFALDCWYFLLQTSRPPENCDN